MAWTFDEKLDAAIRAPLHTGLPRPRTTEVIDRPGWYQLHTPDVPGSGWNEIILSQVDEDEVEDRIDEAIALYHASRHGVKWCVGPWTRPIDMGARLERRGFESWDVRGMGCATDHELAAAAGVEVEAVDETTLEEFLSTMTSGWGVAGAHALHREVLATAIAARPRHAHFFSARVAGKVVGTAGVVVQGASPMGFGYLIGGQVLEEARGRGAYRALISARLVFLRERGHGYAVTHAREATSAPILERLGMETLFRSKCWLLEPPSAFAHSCGRST